MSDINYEMSDIGNGQRFADTFSDLVKFVYAEGRTGCWYVWDGKRWARETGSPARLEWLAKTIVKQMIEEAAQIEDDTQRKRRLDWARACESVGRYRAMIEAAKSEKSMWAQVSEFDRDPNLLNVKNGTVDLRTGGLRPHAVTDRITKLAPVDYVPDAIGQRWPALLERATRCDPSGETATFLEMVLGSMLFGHNVEQRIFLMIGPKASGKSQVAEIPLRVLGPDYCNASTPALITKSRYGRHDTVMSDLIGKRFVIVSETDAAMDLDEAQVKSLTGSAVTNVRRLYNQGEQVDVTWTVLVNANEAPSIEKWDAAIARRVIVIPSGPTVETWMREPNLAAMILEQESEVVLASLVRGAVLWHQRFARERGGFKELPAAVARATQTFEHDNDHVLEFVHTMLEFGDGYSAPNKQVYDAYVAHRRSLGGEPIKSRAFYAALDDRFLAEDRVVSRDTRKMSGVRLRPLGMTI